MREALQLAEDRLRLRARCNHVIVVCPRLARRLHTPMTTRTVAEAITMASEHLLKHSIPLYSEDRNGRPYLRGTGFVVAANGRCYLVTAAHVLDIARSECLFYFAGPRQVCPLREPMVLSKGCLLYTSPSPRD